MFNPYCCRRAMHACFALPKSVLCVHLLKTGTSLRVESPILAEILRGCFSNGSAAVLRVALGESSCTVLQKTNAFCALTLLAVVQICQA